MAEKQTGGTAFPCVGMDNGPGNFKGRPSDGMTLRDYFAAKALSGGEAGNWQALHFEPIDGLTTIENLGLCAYQIADAMLKARNL